MIASFVIGGDREITYWIDSSRWGRGLASAALEAFLRIEETRPLFARVAEHNVGSARVFTRAGIGTPPARWGCPSSVVGRKCALISQTGAIEADRGRIDDVNTVPEPMGPQHLPDHDQAASAETGPYPLAAC